MARRRIPVFPYSFSKLVYFQILIALTFPAYLALAWLEPRFRPPRSPLFAAVLAYFAVILISVIFSVDPERSWWGNQERMAGVFSLLHFLAWLTMIVGLLKKWKAWSRFLDFEIIIAVFMAIVALLQNPYPDLLGNPTGGRESGLLGNPIFMGAYQLFNLSFIALLFIRTRNRMVRVWYGIAASTCLAALIATQSRGELLGLMTVIGVFALYYSVFSVDTRLRLRVLLTFGGFLVLYGFAILFRSSSFIASSQTLSRLTKFDELPRPRLIAWDIAWRGFLERPFTGWGFDTFHILFNQKYDPRMLEFGLSETWSDRVHNSVLEVLAMTGTFGFVTYFAIFAAALVLVWRSRRQGWLDLPSAAILTALPVGYIVQNFFVFDHPAGFSMSFLMFALVISASSSTFGESKAEEITTPEAKTHSATWIGFSILQLLFLVIAWRYSVLPFQASVLSIQGKTLLRDGQIDQGFGLFKRAAAIPTPYIDEQPFFLSRELIGLASRGALAEYAKWPEIYVFTKEQNERYLSSHPEDTRAILIYATFIRSMLPLQPEETRAEEMQLAISYYQRAIETSPQRQQVYFGLGQLYLSDGNPEKALAVFETALSFNEDVGESWWRLGRFKWSNMNRVDGAKDILKAFDGSSPFRIWTAADALIVAEVGQIHDEMGLLDEVLDAIPSLRSGRAEHFLDIARVMERADRIDDRDRILAVLARADGNLKAQLEALQSGLVSTIDESIEHELTRADSDEERESLREPLTSD